MELVYTVVVPTMDRPDDLRRCLAAALAQKPAPAALLVVDDGQLDETALRDDIGPAASAMLKVVRKDKPGLVASLNLAADLVTTPWMLVLDDDIILEPNFMAEITHALEAHGDIRRLAAVAGYPILSRRRRTARGRARRWVERLFLLTGRTEGRFLPSSYFTNYECGSHPGRPWRVEHVPGGLGLWRTEVYRTVRNDPWFEGYAHGCDMEMAWRATRRWEAICVPTARALHDKSPRARTPSTRLGAMKIENQAYFFRKHFAGRPLNHLCHAWATFGYIFLLAAAAATARNDRAGRWAEVRGMIAAVLRRGRRA